jgi:hypothetical protein
MYDYNELYKTCDSVLEKFSEKQTRIEQSEITHNIPNATPSLVLSAIYQLILDNFLLKDSNTVNVFIAITGQGFNLKLKGGYKPYLLELKSKSQLQDSVNTSVINTNNLVGQNVRTQERLTIFALIIASIAAAVPLITLLKDTLLPKPTIDTETISLIKNTQATIHSLKQSLDSLNVSLKNSKNVSYKINTAKKQ